MKSSAAVEIGVRSKSFLTVQIDNRSLGARRATIQAVIRFPGDRWCTMREEFASYGFLAMAVTGPLLLCSGLLAIAFT
jgi:hypothetical protein